MNFKLFGKTILVGNIEFGLCLGHSLSQREGLIPLPFFSAIVLFRHQIAVSPGFLGGFLERFGSLERMEKEESPGGV